MSDVLVTYLHKTCLPPKHRLHSRFFTAAKEIVVLFDTMCCYLHHLDGSRGSTSSEGNAQRLRLM